LHVLQVIIARKKSSSRSHVGNQQQAVFCVGAFLVPNANSVSSKVSHIAHM
jgi:hypothetical protein